jgi:NAD(P)-dependent dehydrogenase (short-subunit alcohol dehydrogenase family)
MRSVRLGRTLEAVFVHYAVMYMTTEGDLRVTLATVAAHLELGGLALVAPDAKTETFKEATEHGNGEGADGRRARYLQWLLPPEPVETVSEIERLGARAVAVQDGVSKVDECEQTVDAAAEGLGGPTLVNNAGVTRILDFLDTDEETYDSAFDLNMKGYVFLARRSVHLTMVFVRHRC